MLLDPFYLRDVPVAIDPAAAVPVLAGPAAMVLIPSSNGTAVRVSQSSTDNLRLTTSRSLSNENVGIVTERVLLRLDNEIVDSVTGKPVTQSAYLVVTVPHSSDFSEATAVKLASRLAYLLLMGDVTSGGGTIFHNPIELGILARVIAGEG
jgi:hypothetical protein